MTEPDLGKVIAYKKKHVCIEGRKLSRVRLARYYDNIVYYIIQGFWKKSIAFN